jgi:hypothetical protein
MDLNTQAEGPVSKSSYFLGDPPPDPRFLASLGALQIGTLSSFFLGDPPPNPRFPAPLGTLQIGTAPSLTEHPGPKDLLVCHRTSWGILPQTPVFSLLSARCKSVQLHH